MHCAMNFMKYSFGICFAEAARMCVTTLFAHRQTIKQTDRSSLVHMNMFFLVVLSVTLYAFASLETHSGDCVRISSVNY